MKTILLKDVPVGSRCSIYIREQLVLSIIIVKKVQGLVTCDVLKRYTENFISAGLFLDCYTPFEEDGVDTLTLLGTHEVNSDSVKMVVKELSEMEKNKEVYIMYEEIKIFKGIVKNKEPAGVRCLILKRYEKNTLKIKSIWVQVAIDTTPINKEIVISKILKSRELQPEEK